MDGFTQAFTALSDIFNGLMDLLLSVELDGVSLLAIMGTGFIAGDLLNYLFFVRGK